MGVYNKNDSSYNAQKSFNKTTQPNNSMLKKITEANTTIQAPVEDKISADLPVFYNPAMKFNRDISILLLKAIDKTQMRICDLMAGTGIRSIRFLSELPKDKILSITINDISEKAAELIRKNIDFNKNYFANKKAEIELTNKNANIFLMGSKGFDYIDIDPFGTPNPFIDSAVRRLSRDGILAVTATDTSALAGTFPKACQRKYWAMPDKGPLKHEVGLRILIRKVQLIAAQYEKAMIPIFSYSKEHHMRVFFRCEKGKSKVDSILKQHDTFNNAGPMWLGTLWDQKLTEKMYQLAVELDYPFEARFLQTMRDESRIPTVGFHDIHNLCKKNKLEVPSFKPILDGIEKKGHDFSKTHFSPYGIRCDIKEKELLTIIRDVIKKT